MAEGLTAWPVIEYLDLSGDEVEELRQRVLYMIDPETGELVIDVVPAGIGTDEVVESWLKG